jgi:hypothetical protein
MLSTATRATPAIALLFAALTGGCGDGRYDAKTPGEPIGRFSMRGSLDRDECRATVLGVVDPWEFDLRLSRSVNDLYWLNGREAISGDIASDDRSFKFDTHVDVPIIPARNGRGGCTLTRRDRAEGELSPDASSANELAGSISFTYEPRVGSECSEIIGVPGGFDRLPCRVDFDLRGTRSDDDE